MNKYEQYKPSGVEWLGVVPVHWEVKRLKFMATIQNGQDYKHIVADEGYPVIGSGGQFAYATNYLYDGKSVLLGRKGTIDKPLYVNGKFWTVDTMFYTQIAKDVVPKFLYYCTLTVDFWRIATQTALPSVTATALSNLQFAVPPFEEQTTIATYLDERTAYIDRLIAKQQALSEKLSEKRTALITEAVCGRIKISHCTEICFKDSGIQWLGKIPEHWEVKRLKYLLSEKLKYGANESAELDDKDLPRYIRITDIREDGQLKEETFKSLEYEKAEEYLLDDLDILLARSGATVGKSYLYRKDLAGLACYAGYLIRARFNQKIANPKFVNYAFQSNFYWEWINAVNIQATIQNVSAEKYNEFTLTLPSLPEQTAIATYLDTETAKIDRLQAKIGESVERLKEYRAALITQVVTGKVKV